MYTSMKKRSVGLSKAKLVNKTKKIIKSKKQASEFIESSTDDESENEILESEIENASIRLPLKQKDIIKLKLNKDEKDSKVKKLINIPMFGKKKNITKSDSESESELSDSDSESNSSESDEPVRKKIIGKGKITGLNKNMSAKKKSIKLSENESDSSSENEKHSKKSCQSCKKKDKKIKELKIMIKELSENVKVTNNIDNKEKTAVLSKLNIMNVIDGKKITLENNDYKCLNCSHEFNGIPCVIPEKYYKNKFYVFGWFCSFNCAAAEIFKMGGHNMWGRYSNLHLFYKKIYGKYTEIKPADKILTLKGFGGKKNIEEYRKDALILDKESRITFPPMITIIPTIENDYTETDNKISNANISLAKATKKPRLKRNKPLPQTGLVKSMGLKLKKKND
jgi:hypothetical protein